MKAKVKWNVKECTYDPSVKQEQTFKVNGTVVLPVELKIQIRSA